jgi:uncharacterized protein DUF4350
MSENYAGKGLMLNWRGPLMVAAIFAAVFAVLLLMAHQNQSNTSDMGSSLRQDPYGTSLLFDSYQRAGYQVERGQDEDSLSDQNASSTAAFFVGGSPGDGWEMLNGKVQGAGKFRGRLENFLARGGRVVLIAPPWELKSESQSWEVANQWPQAPHPSDPTWVSPDLHTMPPGSEAMYLAADAPWLKTDANWTTLYAGSADTGEKTDSSAHVYMAMRRAGQGELVVASQEWFLLNEAIKTHPNPVLLDFLAGGRRLIWVDETSHGLYQEQGVLWLVQRYRLQAALLLFWTALLALLWNMTGDLVRRPRRDWTVEIVRNGEAYGVAGQRLLQRTIAAGQVVAECWEQFRRRSPQDARAISADANWGPRLRAALAQPPLAGYKELTAVIAERRATAKGLARLAHAHRERPRSPASLQTIPEEARIA